MKLAQRGAALRRLLVTRLATDEVFFAWMAAGMAAVVGAVAVSPTTQVYLLSVAWSALVGLMVPQWLEARRESKAFAAARKREENQRLTDHDLASALLTVEGGIMAIRLAHGDAASDRDEQHSAELESITHAIEVEIRRMRRIAFSTPSRQHTCWVADTLEPLLALHRARGTKVDVLLAADVEVAIPPDDLVRAVSNVLDNCAKYAPRSPIAVSGVLSGDRYHLVIRDEGPGIQADLLERACDRGASSHSDGGLGLFSARALIEAAGGHVTVENWTDGLAVGLELAAQGISHRAQRAAEPQWDLGPEVAA